MPQFCTSNCHKTKNVLVRRSGKNRYLVVNFYLPKVNLLLSLKMADKMLTRLSLKCHNFFFSRKNLFKKTQNRCYYVLIEFHSRTKKSPYFLGYHLTQTYIPSIVFVIVAWVSFFVPSDVVPGRMVLCVTTLLTLTSMFNSVRWVWYHAENLKKGLIHMENDLHDYLHTCISGSKDVEAQKEFLLLKWANHQ